MRPSVGLPTFVVGWLLTIVVVIGNGVVIFLIATRRNLRTTTNWFVLSLAVADLGFGAFFFPRYSLCFISDETCRNTGVVLAYSFGYGFTYASVTNLCVLTVDRYLAVVRPLRYVTFMTKKRVAMLIAAAWSVALLVQIACFKLYSPKAGRSSLNSFWVSLHYLTVLACGFLLISTVQVHCVIRRITRKNARVLAQLNFNNKIHLGSAAFRTVGMASAKMLAIVVAVFVVCYLMNGIENILVMFGPAQKDVTFDTEVLPLLKLVNSAINPVAYALYKREIRRELKKLLECLRLSS